MDNFLNLADNSMIYMSSHFIFLIYVSITSICMAKYASCFWRQGALKMHITAICLDWQI